MRLPTSSRFARGLSLAAGIFLLMAAGPTAELKEVKPDPPRGTQSESGPVARFSFDGSLDNATELTLPGVGRGDLSYVGGIDGQALRIGAQDHAAAVTFTSSGLPFDRSRDFSVQFWMRTEADSRRQFVVLSQKESLDNSLASQKHPGWVFYVSGGTWAWNLGSGERRITYERDNGHHMPVNDGRWHQLTMTYSSVRAEVRLFYDGVNRVWYNVSDSEGFDFTNAHPLVVGWDELLPEPRPTVLPEIEAGAALLQDLVDEFNALGLAPLETQEFVHGVVDPRQLFEEKVDERAARMAADSTAFRAAMEQVDWEPVATAENALMANPYTVHQVLNFMDTAPLTRIYELVDGEVRIRREGAATFGEKERLSTPDFDIDNLAVWDRILTPEEISISYSGFMDTDPVDVPEKVTSLTAACWNIWHGGRHFTVDEHGWDSRIAIAEMLKSEAVDVVMMQETYSSGDFIAAELGFHFATTVDRDYLNQGSNISVLSRFPIKEVHVQEDSPFQNVGVRVALSRTQDLYVMSNWYGMNQFPAVFEFHQDRFDESDATPTLFAGDFNAVPHTDGGDSPASVALLDAGFTDAFRSLYPDVREHPGPTHRSGRRIDQLYYKGAGLENLSTKIVSTRPGGFPSDHFLIVSTFDLKYSTSGGIR